MSRSTHVKIVLSVLFAVFCNISYTFACHAIALVNPVQQPTAGGIMVTASSDSPTCGCAVYWLDIEVRRNGTCDPFTGGPLQPGVWVPYNAYPFFQSQQMQKPNCVVQQYPWVVIPFSGLCPGVTYKYRMRENHNGQVGPWTATFTFTVPGNANPIQAAASAANTNLCTGQSTQLSSSLSGGCSSNPTISWSPTTGLSSSTVANPTATPPSTTTYTVTYSDPCGNVSSSASVTINVSPTAIAGTASLSPTAICSGSSTTLTLTGYTGNIQWQSSSAALGPWTNITGGTTSPFTTGPLTATTFFHAVVSGCGTATSNTVAVGVTQSPNVVVSPSSSSICAGGSVQMTASGATSYAWGAPLNTTGSTVTVTPGATTIYSVTGTTNNCSTTVTATVTVNAAPVANAGPDVAICSGSSTQLSGSGGVSCQWSPANLVTVANSCNTTAMPPSTQVYTLQVTDASGCTGTDQVTVTVNQPPPISAGADVSICAGSTAQLGASGATNYTWGPNTNLSCTNCPNPVASPMVTTTYGVAGVDANGCVATDSVIVTVNQIPVANAGPDLTVCNNGSVTLSASGGTSYTWTPNNGTLSCTNCQTTVATPTVNTTYTVVAANGSCTSSDSVFVTMSSIITTTVTVTPPTCNAACDGQAVVAIQGGTSPFNYTWSNNPSQTATATSLCAGTYYVNITDVNGCTAQDSAIIVDPSIVTVNPTATPSTICYGQSSTLSATAAGGTGSGYQYTWGPASSTLSCTSCATPSASPSVTTTYNVVAADANGCLSASQTVTVTVNPPLGLNMSGTASICAGNTTPISVTATGGNGGPYNYSWAPGGTLSCSTCQMTNATPGTTTTYTVTVTDNCGTPAVTGTVTVTVLPPLTVNFTADQLSGCAPLCVTFTDITTPQSVSWTWNVGESATASMNSSSVSHCYNTPGSYNVSLSVVDVNGCPGNFTYNNMITVHPDPVPGFVVSPQPASLITPDITFTPDCQSCDSCIYYIGNDSDVVVIDHCTGFVYTFQDTGMFVVTQEVYSQYGCKATVSHIVEIKPDFILYAPNAFTPNGDGVNDVFLPQGIGIDQKHYELLIFDRWGNLIFETDDMTRGWNGTLNGNKKMVQEDTYVWKVAVQDMSGNKHSYMGHVSVIK